MSLHVGIKAGQQDFDIFVDRITSAYGKRDASNLIENTARAGKKIFVNEKTKDWLSRTGVQFPALAANPVYNEYTKIRVKTLDPNAILNDQNNRSNENKEQAISITTAKKPCDISPKDDIAQGRNATSQSEGVNTLKNRAR